jgi:deoxyribonuclease-4
MVYYLGTHADSSNLIESAQTILNYGGNIIQIYLTLPGSDKTLTRSKNELKQFKEFLEKNNMKVVIHSSLLHNLAREFNDYTWWIKNIEMELKYGFDIGAIGLVIHLGKQLNLTLAEAYNNMYQSLLEVHSKTLEYKTVKIFLETSSCQGTEMCCQMEDLAYFFKKFSTNKNKDIKDRFRICVDTCHIFASGYDIGSKVKVKEFLELFEELIGIRFIGLIHLNNSRTKLGSHLDRHAELKLGVIDISGIIAFYKYFRNLGVPIILETPGYAYRLEIPELLKLGN